MSTTADTAADTAGGPTVDALAEQLATDPVMVGDLFGNGRTAEVEDRLTALVDSADLPVYVVMTQPPDGLAGTDPAADLAARLHARLDDGGDALYVVHLGSTDFGTDPVGFGDAPTVSDYYDAQDRLGVGLGDDRPETPTTPAGEAARIVDTLVSGPDMTRDDWASYATEQPWREPAEYDVAADPPYSPDTMLFPLAFALSVAVTVFLVLGGLRGGPRRTGGSTTDGKRDAARRAPRPTSRAGATLPGPAEVRATAVAELTALHEAVAERGAALTHAERLGRVEGGADEAERLLERVGPDPDEGDLADLVGALVLVRTASAALPGPPRRRRRGKTDDPGSTAGEVLRCCFFDPRHGRATGTRDVPVADRAVEVPVCARCRPREAAPEPLTVPSGVLRRPRPYYETDSVWARTGFGALVDDLWRHVAEARSGRRA